MDVAEQQDEALDMPEWSTIPKLTASDALAKGLERQSSRASENKLDVAAVTSRVNAAFEEMGLKTQTSDKAVERSAPMDDSYFESSELSDVVAAFKEISKRREGLDDPRTADLFAAAGELLQQPECDPQAVASLLRYWSRFESEEVANYLPAFRRNLPVAAQSMNAQNLTSCFFSLAKLERVAPEANDLLLDVIDAIPGRLAEISPEQVCEILYWSSAMDLQEDEMAVITGPLLRSLTPESLNSLSFKDLSRLAWGLAKFKQNDLALLRGIATIVVEKASTSRKKEALINFPMIVMAVTMLRFDEPLRFKMLNAVADRLQRRGVMKKLSGWRLCALSWSWPEDGRVHTFPEHPGEKIKLKDMWVYLLPLLKKRGISKNQLRESVLGPELWEVVS